MIDPGLAVTLLADTWGMHDGDVGTGWMIVMMLGMVVFWGAVIFGVVWLLRESIGRGRGQGGDPRTILDRRLADGKISVEEYEQRKRALGAPPQAHA